MQEETINRLEELAEEFDISHGKVTEMFEERHDDYAEKFAGTDDEKSEIEHWALKVVESDLNNFGEMPVEGTPALTLGAEFRSREHFFTEGDGIIGAAIINPPDDKPGLATILMDTADGIDASHAAEVFAPLNTARLHVSRRKVGNHEGEPSILKYNKESYICESSGNTKLELVDPDDVPANDPIAELPSDRDAKRELINDAFFGPDETVEIYNVPDNLAAANDRGFPVAFGVDMKRFRGRVIDTFVKEEGNPFSYGSIVMIDDSVQADEDVPPELVNDRQRMPGLNVSLAPPYNLYGVDSIIDVYGYVSKRRDTETYQFSAFGAVPLMAEEREIEGGVEDDHEEEVIA